MYNFKANEDILPLSEFRSNLAGYITQTRETGRPIIVTRRSTDVIAVSDETLRKAETLISRDLSSHFGPSQIASGLGMSLRKLNARSKSELGHSVLDEIVRLRVEAAKRMMLDSGVKLAAIAASTGFCNASYFSKVFRRLTGHAPNEWRALHRRA